MEGPAVVADIAPPPQPHNVPTLLPPSSLVPYNISLNLTSILAMIPGSRFLARLRKGVFEMPLDASEIPTASSWASEASQIVVEAAKAEGGQEPPMAPPVFPGPWGFFTSGYIVGLFIMAVLLHRMQNVIIPSRIPTRRARHAYRFGPSFSSSFQHTLLLQRLYAAILPLNFARTTTRLVLHLPSVYFLSRMLLVWGMLVLQTCEMFPTFTAAQKEMGWGAFSWIETLGKWTSQKDMTEICWSTFCAVCAAFLVEGFVKALDGLGGGFPLGNVNTSTSPFNLVGYAFLLHIYSSPIAHTFHPSDGSPSRPDKHVIITITIPLLQLTIFHMLSISKRLSTHRLLPTALTSMLSLAHFHLTLYSHFTKPSSPISPITTAKIGGARRPPPYMGAPNASYPLLNYIPNIFETFLISTILLTVLINAVVQLLVRGRIDRIFSGLGLPSAQNDEDSDHTSFFQNLPLEEDFGVLLLRVGTASLEATGLRGWGNEVAPIQLPRVKAQMSSGRGRASVPDAPTSYGRVRMGRLGVGEVLYGSSAVASPPVSSSSTSRRGTDVPFDITALRRRRTLPAVTPTRQQQQRGFSNDVRTVDLGIPDSASNNAGHISGGSWRRWLNAMRQYLAAVWGVMKGLVVFLLDRARGRVRVRERVRKGGVGMQNGRLAERDEEDAEEEDEENETSKQRQRRKKEREVYQRFLRGEDISDDDDDSEDDGVGLDDGQDEDEDLQDEEEEEVDEGEEAVGLFTDLLRNAGGRGSTISNSGNGEMVLAHLMHGSGGPSPGPLTRRRWNELFQRGQHDTKSNSGREFDVFDDDPWESNNRERPTIFDSDIALDRDAQERDKAMGLQHVCVICTIETREIICWPCRCLSMCDNCREALASRSAPTKHRCPCCRQTVEGYSRIYIP